MLPQACLDELTSFTYSRVTPSSADTISAFSVLFGIKFAEKNCVWPPTWRITLPNPSSSPRPSVPVVLPSCSRRGQGCHPLKRRHDGWHLVIPRCVGLAIATVSAALDVTLRNDLRLESSLSQHLRHMKPGGVGFRHLVTGVRTVSRVLVGPSPGCYCTRRLLNKDLHLLRRR